MIINVLTAEEKECLLNSMNPDIESGERNYTLVWVFLDTDLRVSELTGACMSDLDLNRQCLKVFGKGQYEEKLSPMDHMASKLHRRFGNKRKNRNPA